MHEFGEMMNVLMSDLELMKGFLYTCVISVKTLCQIGLQSPESKEFMEKMLSGFWKGLPDEFLKLSRKNLSIMVSDYQVMHLITELFCYPDNFKHPDFALPSRSIFSMLGLFHEIELKTKDKLFDLLLNMTWHSKNVNCSQAGLAYQFHPALLCALDMVTNRLKVSNSKTIDGFRDIVDVRSPYAKKGLRYIKSQAGLYPGNGLWAVEGDAYLAAHLLTKLRGVEFICDSL